METNWDFDAPTFVDFGNDQHEDIADDCTDDYFNYDHERQRSADLETNHSRAFEPRLKVAVVQESTSCQAFKTPKHIRAALVPAQDKDMSSSPQCTMKKVAIKAKKSKSLNVEPAGSNSSDAASDVKHTGVVTVSQHPVRMPLDPIEQAPGACHVMREADAYSLDDLPEKKPLESVFKDAPIDAQCADTEEGPAAPQIVGEASCHHSEILIKPWNDELGSQQIKMEGDDEMDVETEKLATMDSEPLNKNVSDVVTLGIVETELGSVQRSETPKPILCPRRSDRKEKLKEWRRSGKPKPAEQSSGQPAVKKKKLQLSVPRTPTVLKHQRHTSVAKAKSREERELEEVEQAKQMRQQRLKESSRSFKAAMKAPSPRPETPSKTTKVREFTFATDSRIKASHPTEASSCTQRVEMDFAKGLRQHPASPQKKIANTVPKPFNLSGSKKRKLRLESDEKQGYSFKPLAEAVTDFRNLRSTSKKPGNQTEKGPMKAKRSLLTIAKTPKFETKSRKRTLSVVGAKEKEDQEVEEMKHYQFKARPVNRAILLKPDALPHVEHLRSTSVEEFHLHINKRVEERPKHERTPSPAREFKARPVPKAIIQGPTQLIKADSAKATVPQSPAFQLKHRMALAQLRKENMEKAKEKKEELEPKLSVRMTKPKKLEIPEKRIVAVKPFSFNDRDVKMLAEKERKIKEIYEAERAAANAFRATPMMFDLDGAADVPEKEVRPPTKVKPFHLASEERGASKSERFKADLENECRVLRDKTHVIANTNYKKSLYGDGFKPIVAKKYTDTFDEFSLRTNARASSRREFDERQKQAEAAAVQAAEESRRIEEEREEREQLKSRKLAEHKAAPIRRYKDLVIHPSVQGLTEPQSPSFSDRFYKKNPASSAAE